MIDRATVLATFGIGLAIWLLSTLTELAGRIHRSSPLSESWRRSYANPGRWE